MKPEAHSHEPPGARGLPAKTRGLVLLVDDDVGYREVTCQMLEEAGHHVEVAKDGAEAVRRAKELMPDVIVLDLEMPVMNGYDALEEIRRDESRRHSTKADGSKPEVSPRRAHIIVLSAAADANQRRRAFDSGCDQYIVKAPPGEAVVGAVSTVFWRLRGGVD